MRINPCKKREGEGGGGVGFADSNQCAVAL